MMLRCPIHQAHRKMMAHVGAVYATSNDNAEFETGNEEAQMHVLLGARAGAKEAEDVIDVQVKRFLVKAWKARRYVGRVVNRKFDRMDVMWSKDWDRRWPDHTSEAEADGNDDSARTTAQRSSPDRLSKGVAPPGVEQRAPRLTRSTLKIARASAPARGARRRLFN